MKNNIIKTMVSVIVTQLMAISITMACDESFALEALDSAYSNYKRIIENDLRLNSEQVEWDIITNSYTIIDVARTCNVSRIKTKAAEMLALPLSLESSLINFQVSFYLSFYKKLCQNDIVCSLAVIESTSKALTRFSGEKFVNSNEFVAGEIVRIYKQTPHSTVKNSAIKVLQKCATKKHEEPTDSSKFCDKAIMEILTN